MSRLLLVGCGNMGKALLKGWLSEKSFFSHIDVVTRSGTVADLEKRKGLMLHREADLSHISISEIDMILFAVKPHQLKKILPKYAAMGFTPNVCVVSVAAGVPLASLEAVFSKHTCVRVMPNTPSQVGEGMIVLRGNTALEETQKIFLEQLFSSVGAVAWAACEDDFHLVTALSGSGPAYVFLLGEALEKAAQSLGMSKEMAHLLATQTLKGASIYGACSEKSFSVLRSEVTSPNGTTQAGLKVLCKDGKFFDLIEKALKSASLRSRELACIGSDREKAH